MVKEARQKLKGKKTIGIALAQIMATWAFYLISNEISVKIAIGYSIFAVAQAINRFFTDTPLKLDFRK